MQSSLIPARPQPVRIWLIACTLLVCAMVVVGGLTRLTESGLSMVTWEPVKGILPPLSDAGWEAEFDRYRLSPQYQKVFRSMSVEEFKGIFWLEYIHRLLGRLVGMVFFLPMLFFLWKKWMPLSLGVRMAGIFLLGAMQGVMGWYMVKSGLVNDPAVSPVRLMLHLSLAFLLFALLFWHVLLLSWQPEPSTSPLAVQMAWVLVIGVFIQVMLGGLVAGMDAGLLYNTFPTMEGEWVPNGVSLLEPWWHNLMENPTAVQFYHRVGALILTIWIAVCGAFFWIEGGEAIRKFVALLVVILTLQIALGALTVIYGVPILLASLHQTVAIALFAVSLALLYGLSQNSQCAIKVSTINTRQDLAGQGTT